MNLFVYGTLLNGGTQMRVLGKRIQGVPAELPGFVKDTWGHYFIIRKDPGSFVGGMVLKGLTREDMVRLDRYEGIPNTPYERITVTVSVVGSDETMDCFAYAYK